MKTKIVAALLALIFSLSAHSQTWTPISSSEATPSGSVTKGLGLSGWPDHIICVTDSGYNVVATANKINAGRLYYGYYDYPDWGYVAFTVSNKRKSVYSNCSVVGTNTIDHYVSNGTAW